MNTKFSIGIVIAIVLQVSAFVWWTAQQAQTISQLNDQVTELTSKMAIESSINMQRDIEDIKATLVNLDVWINENYQDIENLIYFATFTENRWAEAYATDDSYVRRFGTKVPPKE